MPSDNTQGVLDRNQTEDETNNPDIEPDIKKLKRRLSAVRETIAYKEDERRFMDHNMIDLAFHENIDVEYTYYQNQDLETLYKHEQRLVKDLATLGVDASLSGEREREELQTEDMNEQVDLDSLDQD